MGIRRRWVATTIAAMAAAPGAIANTQPPTFTPVATYATGLGGGSAETVAFEGQRMFVTNSDDNSFDVVDLSRPTEPHLVKRVTLAAWGSGPTSVAVKRGLVAVAVTGHVATDLGRVVFFDSTGMFRGQVRVGADPDMVTFTGNGRQLLVANEGEPSSYGQADSVDPEGSVSIVDIPMRSSAGWTPQVRHVTFGEFNHGESRSGELPAGIRLNGPGANVAQDLEPEYIATSGRTAYVTLQENNAVAVIDVRRAVVRQLIPLGTIDHSIDGFGIDASDRDGAIAIRQWPVNGMFMPDAIASFRVRGTRYLITANEGDGRDYDGFSDESRVSALTLTMPDGDTLRRNENLGRLTVSSTDGAGAAGAHGSLFSFGTRSATIWNAATGVRVWDSGDMFESVTSAVAPSFFNASNTDNTFDSRSDNKGPEPEAVTTGRIGKRTYAFVGLERIGGFMVLDVSTPSSPRFVQWANNRDYTSAVFGPDSGPEIIRFVLAARSPLRRPTVIVANEISGTVSLYTAD